MKKKYLILTIVILLTLLVAGLIAFIHTHQDEEDNKIRETNVTEAIDKYGYSLTDRDTEYFKELFEKLKNTLNQDKVDEELYATLVSQLFTTDFYTLSNKLGSSDIGGLQFVVESYRDNFALKAKDTMYKSVKNNLYGDRDQQLPTVIKASVDDVSTTTYTLDSKKYSGYNVKVSISYETDLSYPTKANLTLIKNDKKLEIVKVA